MKIQCDYCECAFDAMSEKCPNCGAVNDKASQYANQHEKTMWDKEQARRDVYEDIKSAQTKIKKVAFIVYGLIFLCFILPVFIGIALSIGSRMREQREAIDRNKQKQEQLQEEQSLKAEEEKKLKEYNEEVIEVSGINTVVQKDLYYSIQVEDVVPYELNYDHNVKDWGYGNTSEPTLLDGEHRLAIHIKVKNFQDKLSIYNDPSRLMKLYIEDENADSIVIQEDGYLNGSNDDNYYSGGKKISGNEFTDNYGKTLEKNQTMSWWVPIVVNENSKKIVLHFDYNMSITVDNPYAKN